MCSRKNCNVWYLVTIFGNVDFFGLISCFVATQFCFGRKYFVGQKRKRNACIFWIVALWIFFQIILALLYLPLNHLANLSLYLKRLQWFEKDFASDIIYEKSYFQIAEAYWNDWWKPKKPSNNNTFKDDVSELFSLKAITTLS